MLHERIRTTRAGLARSMSAAAPPERVGGVLRRDQPQATMRRGRFDAAQDRGEARRGPAPASAVGAVGLGSDDTWTGAPMAPSHCARRSCTEYAAFAVTDNSGMPMVANTLDTISSRCCAWRDWWLRYM